MKLRGDVIRVSLLLVLFPLMFENFVGEFKLTLDALTNFDGALLLVLLLLLL